MYEWNTLPWKKIQCEIFKLQKRIYQASLHKDNQKVHKLQRLLLSSWAAKALAVRKVSQDNRGKRTAGIDGRKNLTAEQRMQLVVEINVNEKAKPVRRIWIDKPGKNEKRPLGIPTIRERARQALVKLALEPEWEAKFEANSYGFRPGRSAHDAIEAIFCGLNQKPKYVLDADIKSCFDKIDHKALLQKIQSITTIQHAIKGWLKAGIMDGNKFFASQEGAPQGSIISPLLANIALHGLETTLHQSFPDRKTTENGKVKWKPVIVRYADDFLIFHPDLPTLQRARAITVQWLKEIGLELSENKTCIRHTLYKHEGKNTGFDFLGFTIKQYHASRKRGFKTIIIPSKQSINKHQRQLKESIRAGKDYSQEKLIRELNPKISGWSNYYKSVCAKETYAKMDYLLWQKLYRWARKKHPKTGRKIVVRKYWNDQWRFRTKEGYKLNRHTATKIVRYVKVLQRRSPFDGDLVYWSTRMGKSPLLPARKAMMLRNQQGKCAHCGMRFMYGDLIELHHMQSLAKGGAKKPGNISAVHGHCHDSIHRQCNEVLMKEAN